MISENETKSENVQLNGENKSEPIGQANNEMSSTLQVTPIDPVRNDQFKSNPLISQPPPHQNPPIQPLMNMPMQSQGPPAQFSTPPPFTGFGMPPPNFMYPPNPWSMPWQQPMPQQMGNDKRIIDPQVLCQPISMKFSTFYYSY